MCFYTSREFIRYNTTKEASVKQLKIAVYELNLIVKEFME